MRCDVVVVGGGLSGLTAATFLAKRGKRVVLCERSNQLGGRAITTTLAGGSFNLGPHALYRGGRAIGILRELGVAFSGSIPSTSGSYAYREGRLEILPGGLVSLVSSGLLNLGEKLDLARLLTGLMRYSPDASLDSLTLREWLDTRIAQPRVRELIQALFRLTTYANAPALQSAGAALEQFAMALKENVLYLDGGWQNLVEGLAEKAQEAGAQLRTSVPVRRVNLHSGRVTGVALADGSTLDADSVVLAVAPQFASKLADLPGSLDAPPMRAACLDVALSRLPNPKRRFALGIDEPLYAAVPSQTAKLSETGVAVVHLARYLAPEEEGAAYEAQLEQLLRTLQPGCDSVILGRRFLPNLIVSNAHVLAAKGGLKGRPSVEVPGATGLFVAGDWVGEEGMLTDAALASAKAVAERICSENQRPAAAA